jgi:hypothetical protein
MHAQDREDEQVLITHSFARAPWLVEGAARSLDVCFDTDQSR